MVAAYIDWKENASQSTNNNFYVVRPESDVCRRPILTYRNGPRTDRIILFIMVMLDISTNGLSEVISSHTNRSGTHQNPNLKWI